MNALQSFDGRDVRGTSISVTNAGDGLSKSLKVEPRELHIGEKVYVVLECEVTKLRYAPIGDTSDLNRDHVLRAGVGTLVDKDLVNEVVETQRERIRVADDEAKGRQRLDPIDRIEEHNQGLHKRKRKDCAECQAEVEEARRIAESQPKKPRKPRTK